MLILAIVALMLSGGVTYIAYRVLQGRVAPTGGETVQVVVAAKPLVTGTRLAKEDIQLAAWPKSSPLQGTFSDPSAPVGRAILIPTQVNEPILESKLAPKEGGAGLMAVIPEGMRALTIQVNSIIGVSGFVVPGSRVDLILTAIPPKDVKGAKNDEMGSKIVLENLEVLAAGQNVQKDIDGKPQTVAEVTLLLTPEQAERVALATGDGRIQRALRSPLDKTVAQPPLIVRSRLYDDAPGGAKLKDLFAQADPPKPKGSGAGSGVRRPAPVKVAPVVAPPPPPPPAPRVFAVELIQGSNRKTEKFEEKKTGEKEKVLEEKKF